MRYLLRILQFIVPLIGAICYLTVIIYYSSREVAQLNDFVYWTCTFSVFMVVYFTIKRETFKIIEEIDEIIDKQEES